MDKTKVLVVDHSEIIRQGIHTILKVQSFNYEVNFSDNPREISEQIRSGKVDILLVTHRLISTAKVIRSSCSGRKPLISDLN